MEMKRYGWVICWVVVLGFGYVSAWAQYGTSTQIGDTTFYSLSDPDAGFISGTSMRIGDTTFHNFSSTRGGSAFGTSNDIGGITFHNFSTSDGSLLSGTTMRIGGTAFHDLRGSDGRTISGTSTKIGKTVFHDFTAHEGFKASSRMRRNSEMTEIYENDPSPSMLWRREEKKKDDVGSFRYWEPPKPFKTPEQAEADFRPYGSPLDDTTVSTGTGRLKVENNPLGGYRLRDDRGNSWQVKEHPLGGYRVTDEKGNTYRARKNLLGKFDIEKE